MNKHQKMVKEFHEKFNIPVGSSPHFPSPEVIHLRFDLIDEEFEELKQAYINKDLVNFAQELTDLLYVTYGTAVSFGIDIEKIFEAIHNSNMTKSHTRDKRGKISKGENYVPPKIREIMENKTVTEVTNTKGEIVAWRCPQCNELKTTEEEANKCLGQHSNWLLD
jgi:predicted HAD superfamily Cof-like phosphohydrolase